jgi:hypothetical protein
MTATGALSLDLTATTLCGQSPLGHVATVSLASRIVIWHELAITSGTARSIDGPEGRQGQPVLQHHGRRQCLALSANSTSHSPRFVKPFFSQILLEGPFVTAGEAWKPPLASSVTWPWPPTPNCVAGIRTSGSPTSFGRTAARFPSPA